MVRFLTLAAVAIVFEIAVTEPNSTVSVNSFRGPKHRTELVDEAFPEQKDVLLEMLEAKLKQVKDKKKKKRNSEKSDLKWSPEQNPCVSSKDKSLIMRANGISNVGIVNLLMNHGTSGKGHLNLDADGISNVGRAHLELGMEGGVNVPGISNSLFAAPLLPNFNSIFCDNQELKEVKPDLRSANENFSNVDKESLLNLDVNNNSTLIDANSTTKSDVNIENLTNNAKNATENATKRADSTSNVDINNIPTNGRTIDINDIKVRNITASVSDITSAVPSSVTALPANTVTIPSNLNTVKK